MKIYSLGKFIFGIAFILCAISWAIICIVKGSLDFKQILCILIMAFLGSMDIIMSLRNDEL